MKSFDVLVIGSGFGGSVAAHRLTEKGYRVGVLEAGARYDESTFPKTSWDVRRFLWAPRLGWFGIQRIHRLRNVIVLAGAGVGGGSLNYANTLYEPLEAFYDDPQWSHITDWRAELAPYFKTAKRMLGVVRNPTVTPADEHMLRIANEMGVGDTFHLAPVGVFFGEPGVEVDDPYFGGTGPRRSGCLQCGSCMTGCRFGAKNMLTKNYLYFAERAGAQVFPLRTVVRVRPLSGGGGYLVETVRTKAFWQRARREVFTAEQVVLAAGTYGTQRLLHRMKASGDLPELSDRLGTLTRTNSEALLGAMAKSTKTYDFTQGVAITSSFHPDPSTHIEPVRYGKGSNLMGLLKTYVTDGGGRVPRWAKFLGTLVRHPSVVRGLSSYKFSERTIIALVMQSLDNSLVTFERRGILGRRLSSRQGHGAPNPGWIPAGNEAVRRLAANIDGIPGGTWGELVNVPMTAHFLGGCTIGDSPSTGVVDPYHRVYGHPGLHIVDGSAITANLGANPSLTITAQAERAMAYWPVCGDADPRPSLGAPYVRVDPVPAGSGQNG